MTKIKKLFLTILLLQVSCICSVAQTQSKKQLKQSQKEIEQQLFPGAILAKNFKFNFPDKFEEKFINTKDDVELNGILFKADSAKGLIFYLQGSNNALNKWGEISQTYTSLRYDLFMLDYRGHGKSGGKINSEKQLYIDVQDAYNDMKIVYPEKNIIILGQSIGTGPATMLAANNHPKKLILQAPYYSITDWIQNVVPNIDTSVIMYKFNTYQFLQKTTVPIIIFHGDADNAIYYGSSKKLSAFFKQGDRLITLKGEGHNDFTKNKDYLEALKTILQ